MSELTPTRPMLRYFGGKWALAPWIVSHFPAHRIYVEPFGGAASVLFNKPRCEVEIYNDKDGEIVNLFLMVQTRGAELLRHVELTPYARAVFEESFVPSTDPLEWARRTLVRSYMGFGGNLTRPNRDQTPQRTGFRLSPGLCSEGRTRSPAQDWRNWPSGLPALIDRLRGVVIENREAIEVCERFDGPQTLHYIDTPYVHDTRGYNAGGSHRGYRFELTNEEHAALAARARALAGMVLWSGYGCALYDELLPGWTRMEKATHADGARDRVEVLWLNPAASRARASEQNELRFEEAGA